MARMSTKENKSIYQKTREDLGYSREKAADILETIPPERIERIESGKRKRARTLSSAITTPVSVSPRLNVYLRILGISLS